MVCRATLARLTGAPRCVEVCYVPMWSCQGANPARQSAHGFASRVAMRRQVHVLPERRHRRVLGLPPAVRVRQRAALFVARWRILVVLRGQRQQHRQHHVRSKHLPRAEHAVDVLCPGWVPMGRHPLRVRQLDHDADADGVDPRLPIALHQRVLPDARLHVGRVDLLSRGRGPGVLGPPRPARVRECSRSMLVEHRVGVLQYL
jgi:hypothetical protein